jgi:hypothetical protein
MSESEELIKQLKAEQKAKARVHQQAIVITYYKFLNRVLSKTPRFLLYVGLIGCVLLFLKLYFGRIF